MASKELCRCGHSVWNHYDGVYCMDDGCHCAPCEKCDRLYVQVNYEGECFNCASLSSKVRQVPKVPKKATTKI